MTTATESLPATTAMGAVHVTVADLERSLGYYREEVGLQVGSMWGENRLP